MLRSNASQEGWWWSTTVAVMGPLVRELPPLSWRRWWRARAVRPGSQPWTAASRGRRRSGGRTPAHVTAGDGRARGAGRRRRRRGPPRRRRVRRPAGSCRSSSWSRVRSARVMLPPTRSVLRSRRSARHSDGARSAPNASQPAGPSTTSEPRASEGSGWSRKVRRPSSPSDHLGSLGPAARAALDPLGRGPGGAGELRDAEGEQVAGAGGDDGVRPCVTTSMVPPPRSTTTASSGARGVESAPRRAASASVADDADRHARAPSDRASAGSTSEPAAGEAGDAERLRARGPRASADAAADLGQVDRPEVVDVDRHLVGRQRVAVDGADRPAPDRAVRLGERRRVRGRGTTPSLAGSPPAGAWSPSSTTAVRGVVELRRRRARRRRRCAVARSSASASRSGSVSRRSGCPVGATSTAARSAASTSSTGTSSRTGTGPDGPSGSRFATSTASSASSSTAATSPRDTGSVRSDDRLGVPDGARARPPRAGRDPEAFRQAGQGIRHRSLARRRSVPPSRRRAAGRCPDREAAPRRGC